MRRALSQTFVADDNFLVVVYIHLGMVTILDPAGEHFLSQRILQQPHHSATQGAGSIGRVVSLFHQPLLERIGHGEGDAFLAHPAEDFLQHDFGDLLHLVATELTEHDDLVESVEEFRAEVLLQLLIHEGADAGVLRLLSTLTGELETEATATLLDHLRTDVRGHDHQGVLEVDRAALGIGQTAIFKELQQQVEHIRVRFLDFIEQHHGVRTASHSFRELTAFVEADIARRRTDQLADRMALHELRHVEADHRLLTAEEIGGQSLGELGLTDTGWAGEDEAGDGTVRVLQTDTGPTDGFGHRLDRFVLTDQTLVQRLLHVQQLHRFALRELLHRHAGPGGNDLGNVLLVHHGRGLGGLCRRRITRFSGRFSIGSGIGAVGLQQRADLIAQLNLLFTQFTGLGEVLVAYGVFFLFLDAAQLLVHLLGLGWEFGIEQSNP